MVMPSRLLKVQNIYCLYVIQIGALLKSILAWRNTPRADGLAPADLFYGRRLRTNLPSVRSGEPVLSDAIATGLRKRNVSSAAAREHYDSSSRSLSPLEPGQRVSLLDPQSGT